MKRGLGKDIRDRGRRGASRGGGALGQAACDSSSAGSGAGGGHVWVNLTREKSVRSWIRWTQCRAWAQRVSLLERDRSSLWGLHLSPLPPPPSPIQPSSLVPIPAETGALGIAQSAAKKRPELRRPAMPSLRALSSSPLARAPRRKGKWKRGRVTDGAPGLPSLQKLNVSCKNRLFKA